MSPEVAEWFATWWPLWTPFLLLIVGASATGIWVIVNRKGGERAARKNPLPPTWPEMWARIDALEARVDAVESERDELQAKYDAVVAHSEKQEAKNERFREDMFAHLVDLERLVPNPPGPPPRPAWLVA